MYACAPIQNFPLTYAAWDTEYVIAILYMIFILTTKAWCCHNTYLASEIDGLPQ